MKLRVFILQMAVLTALFMLSCGEPPKTVLKTWLPAETLIYAETSNLSRIGLIFTENKDWKSISAENTDYLSFLNKQAAIGVLGFQNSEHDAALQVKPHVVLLVDTQMSEAAAITTAERIVWEFSHRFLAAPGEIEKRVQNGTSWRTVTGAEDKKIFSAISGSVVLIGNDEAAIARCLEVKRGGANLSANAELRQAEEESKTADQLSFGYVSPAGAKELSNYLGVSYAMKGADDDTTRGLISDILPGLLQNTVDSITWTARPVETGVEDTYHIKTGKEFARNIFRTIKPSAADDARSAARHLPDDIHSVSYYHLEDPQLAWRGMVLSLAAQMDAKGLVLFEQFSRQLLKPYGIDDPELFLSGASPPVVTARFDEDGNESVVIVKVKDREKISKAISETFDFSRPAETFEGAEVRKSRDGAFAAAFTGEEFIIGNTPSVINCLKTSGDNQRLTAPTSFAAPGALVRTRQKDDTAIQILSGLAERNGQAVKIDSYFFSETSFEPPGIKRRTLSAFGLYGELFRQLF